MPVTLTSINDLQLRHLKRFADMNARFVTESGQAGLDLMAELEVVHSGQPQGSARVTALKNAGHPFATRWGAPLWPTPPIGVISGKLKASLSVDYSHPLPNVYSNTGKSSGVDYAQYIYSPTGTSKMLPRGVLEAMNQWSESRMIRMGRDLMAFQITLL